MKRKLRLTESDLHRIVRESVNILLKEGKTGVFNDNGEYMGYETHYDDYDGDDDTMSQYYEPNNWWDDLYDDLAEIAKERVIEIVNNILKNGDSISILKNGLYYPSDSKYIDNEDEFCYLEGDKIVYGNYCDDLLYKLYNGHSYPYDTLTWSQDMQNLEFKFNVKDILKGQ